MAKEMNVLITGPANTGKTTVQRIITAALAAHGIKTELGATAQHELEVMVDANFGVADTAPRVAETTTVKIDEKHLFQQVPFNVGQRAVPTVDISDAEIKRIMLAHGYKEKDQGNGVMDLNPYVYEAARALMSFKPAPILPADPDAPKLFEIWTTGYRATGNDIKAEKLGEEYGATFADACLLFFKKQGKSNHLEINSRGVPEIPGFCHLTDNETDARRFNG